MNIRALRPFLILDEMSELVSLYPEWVILII